MKTALFSKMFVSFILIALISHSSTVLAGEEEDWWAQARSASCAELIDAYKTTKKAEHKVVNAIKEANGATILTNVLGVASFAILGIGFFTWDDNASAEENLADLRNDLKIITTVAEEKKCALPVMPN